ncbi:MAG TPA: dicarboxylate transporter/tellurite-resistance protein TehA [Magnetospirillaceae bacterium]|jgi:tellurite resistance protein
MSAIKLPIVPASFFAIVLGLCGLGGAWRAAHRVWETPVWVSEALMAAAVIIWIILAVLYILKWVFVRAAAKAELMHPIQCCFIGLGGVSTMLVGGALLPYSRIAAVIVFAVGAILTVCFGVWRTGLLWQGDRDPSTTTPVLLLPTAAGAFVAATNLSALGYPDWGQVVFGIGFFSWLAIESILIHRLYTMPQMIPALRPTLGIMLAPPTVGGIAYLSGTVGAPDALVHAMLGYGILQALVLIRLIRWLRAQPFGAGYWAFTFGASALATLAIRLVDRGDTTGPVVTSAPYFLGLASLVIAVIALATLRQLLTGKLVPAPVPAAAPAPAPASP